jgi:hypothetical protein
VWLLSRFIEVETNLFDGLNTITAGDSGRPVGPGLVLQHFLRYALFMTYLAYRSGATAINVVYYVLIEDSAQGVREDARHRIRVQGL